MGQECNDSSRSYPGIGFGRSLYLRVTDFEFWIVLFGFCVFGYYALRWSLPLAVLLIILGVVLGLLNAGGSDRIQGYEHEVTAGEEFRHTVSMIRWMVTPWGLYTFAVQTVGNLVAILRYRGRPPSRDRMTSDTELSLPFDGEWTVVNGGVTQATSHSWSLVSQRYAYDFLITDEDGETHEGDGTRLNQYYAYGEPIVAPAAGTIIATENSLRDYPRPGQGWIEWRTWNILGNHVIIRHETGEFSLLAHLRQRSVTVSPGDTVNRGTVVGECGNSGHSTEPHLHYQLQDKRNFWISAGLVPRFAETSVSRTDALRQNLASYDSLTDEPATTSYLFAGDRVRRLSER